MSSRKNNTAVVAYVPVPHAGYIKFFRAHMGKVFYLVDDWFIRQFQPLVRHLPGVSPEEALRMIRSLGIFSSTLFFSSTTVADVRKKSLIIMPDEDVSHALAEKYLPGVHVTFDGCWRLRWDWGSTQMKRRPEGECLISTDELNRELMRTAFSVANKSPDWWRQIGALLVKDREGSWFAFYQF